METFQIKEEELNELQKDTSRLNAFLKKLLHRKREKGDIFARTSTYEDCCEELGEDPIDEETMLKAGFTMDEIVYRRIKTITRAINEGWNPNMLDTSQKKWIPVFSISPSGLVFCGACCGCSNAYAGDASRLCFETEAKAIHAGKKHLETYSKFII